MPGVRRLLPPPTADDVDLDEVYAVPVSPRPHIRVNFVSSADGAVEFAGHSEPLSGPADKRVFSLLRGLADVILVGAGTARLEGYGPARPSADRQRRRVETGRSPVPPIALVSGGLDLDESARFFTEAVARPLILTAASAPPERVEALARVADLVVCGDQRVDLHAALEVLAERGLHGILCEGGPALFGQLIAADLVDELCLTLSPALAGGGWTRMALGLPPETLRRLSLGSLLTDDDALFLRYTRR